MGGTNVKNKNARYECEKQKEIKLNQKYYDISQQKYRYWTDSGTNGEEA
jgi:hypothetical protein